MLDSSLEANMTVVSSALRVRVLNVYEYVLGRAAILRENCIMQLLIVNRHFRTIVTKNYIMRMLYRE